MSDTTIAEAQPQDSAVATMGDEYIPRQITEDDLGELSLDDAYAASMVLVEGPPPQCWAPGIKNRRAYCCVLV